jgi:hypothetical protein
MDISLQASLGLAWVLGCCGCGMFVIRHSADCNATRQYLCQACALVCSVAILALTAVQGVAGHLIVVWVSKLDNVACQYLYQACALV